MNPEILEWYSYALDDLHQARRNLRARKYPSPNGASVNAQQCAEKALKALIRFQGKRAKKIHDLVQLMKTLDPIPPELRLMERDLEMLFTSAGIARYPGNMLTMEEARRDLKTATRLFELIAQQLGLPGADD